jgi:hypothetical protein
MSKRCLLWRILGNDLPPRHDPQQTVKNTQFILDHEEDHDDLDKRFLLNRIVDPGKADVLKACIRDHGHEFDEIPFELEEYRKGATEEDRLLHTTNLNRARNHCVRRSWELGYSVSLPFDGASFLRRDGWSEFYRCVSTDTHLGYIALPIWRADSYMVCQSERQRPELTARWINGDRSEIMMSEPQIAFTRRADKVFNESLPWGYLPKVELIWRLGIPGMWDRWEPKMRSQALKDKSTFFRRVPVAGWVVRLPSGNSEAEANNEVRWRNRNEGGRRLVQALDTLVSKDDTLSG